jgi:hypothetical protein
MSFSSSMPFSGAPNGYQNVTQSGTTALALTVPAGAVGAIVVVSTQAARFRADGTDPTATVGMPVAAGGTLALTGAWLTRGKFIAQTGTITLDATFFG